MWEKERFRTAFRRTMTMLAAMEATSNKRNSTNMYEDAILPEYNVTTTASGAASKTSHFETDLHGNVNILLGGWVTGFRCTILNTGRSIRSAIHNPAIHSFQRLSNVTRGNSTRVFDLVERYPAVIFCSIVPWRRICLEFSSMK